MSNAGLPAGHDDTEQAARPPFEMTQSNVELANTYRLELNKQLLTIATALFAFTIAFFVPPAAGTPVASTVATYKGLAWTGWAALAVSILAGLTVMRLWERFYISYRDYDNRGKRDEGQRYRNEITARRIAALRVQYVTFVIGVVAVGFFAALRLGG